MSATATTTVLGLTAAIIWGAADFSGGIGARYLRVYWLLAISHASSLIALVLLADLLHQPLPDARILTYGLISGVAGGIALLVFYHALSLGSMGTTAAVTGLLTAALPVLFSLATIGAPSHRQIAGFVLAAGAIWLISSPASPNQQVVEDQRKKLVLAVISGIGFGIFLIALREANGGGLLWPLAASRVGSLVLAVGGGLILSRGHFMAEPEPDSTGTTMSQTLVDWDRPGAGGGRVRYQWQFFLCCGDTYRPAGCGFGALVAVSGVDHFAGRMAAARENQSTPGAGHDCRAGRGCADFLTATAACCILLAQRFLSFFS